MMNSSKRNKDLVEKLSQNKFCTFIVNITLKFLPQTKEMSFSEKLKERDAHGIVRKK